MVVYSYILDASFLKFDARAQLFDDLRLASARSLARHSVTVGSPVLSFFRFVLN